LLPALVKEALVVLRDVALGDEPRIIRMRPRMPQAHRQILGVPAAEAARARQTHLTPIVDVVLLEHAGGAVVGLAAGTDRALDLLKRVPPQQHEMPEFGLARASGQAAPDTPHPTRPSPLT